MSLKDFLAHHRPQGDQQGAREPERAARLHSFGDDAGNAERLVHHFGDQLRYCAAWGKWLVWDGGRWVVDRGEAHVQYALALAERIWEEEPLLVEKLEANLEREKAVAEARKLVRRQRKKIRSDSGTRALLRLGRSKAPIAVVPEELDAHHWLLNVRNGTLNLQTGCLKEAEPADHLTKQAPVRYDESAPCPRWRAFLRWATCGDAELADYLQRLAGYALTGDVSEQALPVFYGHGGNGKSVWIEVMLAILGDYAKTGAPFLLEDKGRVEHPTDVADLFGARLVTLNENKRDRPLHEGLVKQLTGGDRLKARFMRQDFFSFDPTHTIIMAVNHQPLIRGTDEGIWRRIHLVPWQASLAAEERDPHLRSKLLQEAPGILAWAVEGCMAWQRDGLAPPEVVQAATRAYRSDMDIVGQFLGDCCVIDPGANAPVGELYRRYKEWCDEAGHRPMSATKLGRDLSKRGFEPDQVGGGMRVRRGLRLPPVLAGSRGW